MNPVRFLKHFFTHKRLGGEIYPDEIFLDASNLPDFDRNQFEGRIEKPISKTAFRFFGAATLLVGVLFLSRLWHLQIAEGAAYTALSEQNRLRQTVIFPERGLILDRTGRELAWNEPNPNEPFPLRKYSTLSGLSHAVGYAKEPARDASGNYYQDRFIGETGVEQIFDDNLAGKNGTKIVETNARGVVMSESVSEPPVEGESITLSLDGAVSDKLYDEIKGLAERSGFTGGAGAIMDVHTGELIALTSYPEYDANVLATGNDKTAISRYLSDPQNPFLNRAVAGLYAPGSTIKPYIALAALEENIISPDKQILSTGSISIPNPFLPGAQSVFRDWKAHGWVDMYHALAVSSDVYFYVVGGGFKDQKGIGIDNIKKYTNLFGFGHKSGIAGFAEPAGVIPDPAWKEANFEDGQWRIGDTYHTAIGQYGFQVTVLQEVRATASLANDGTLPVPSLIKGGSGEKGVELPFAKKNLAIVRQGMRLGVREGITSGLNFPYVTIAAKSGTAEIGTTKKHYVNSWITGFFPYENPRYAFVVVMEKGPITNTVGALYVMRQTIDWMHVYTPEYLTAE